MLNKLWRKWCLTALLLFSMVTTTGILDFGMSIYAEEGDGTATFSSVHIDSESFIEAKDIYILPVSVGYASISFKLTVHNEGLDEIDFDDYWVRLLTKSGSSYLVKLIPQDKIKNRVSAGTEQSFTFYGEVSSDLKPEDLIIRVFKWDFTQENYEKVIGDMQASTSVYTAAAPYGDKKLFEMTGVATEASVSRVLLNRNDKNTLVTIYVKLLNSGSTSFDIPDLRYLIKTTDGSVFPAELGKSGKKSLVQPGESKEIQINAVVPAEYDMGKGLELLFAQSIPVSGSQPIETKVVPLASFSLITDNQAIVGNRISAEFSTKDGIYEAELQTIQRLPWEDKDLLSANLVIRNPSSKLLSVPRMTGYFMLDDKVKIEAAIVQIDDVTGLAGHSEIHFQAVGKIAYQSSVTSVKLVLQELDEAKATNDLVEFLYAGDLSAIPVLAQHQEWKVAGIGNKANYSIKDVSTYTSETTDLFITELHMENKESRSIYAGNLTAFLKDMNGTMYATTIAVPTKKIVPGGKAMLSIAAVVPKEMSKKGLQLLVGKSIKGSTVAGQGDTADAYYDVSALKLPEKEDETQHVLKKINLFPFELSLSSFKTRANLYSNEVSITFRTELTKDGSVEANTEGHNLFIEINDSKSEVNFSERVVLEASNNMNAQSDSKVIKLGNSKYTMGTHDEDFYTSYFSGEYQLNIYDEYMGHRRLITTKPVSWYGGSID